MEQKLNLKKIERNKKCKEKERKKIRKFLKNQQGWSQPHVGEGCEENG